MRADEAELGTYQASYPAEIRSIVAVSYCENNRHMGRPHHASFPETGAQLTSIVPMPLRN